jgi:phage-related baseplate assembly protein
MTIDLSALPKPTVIRELDYEAIVERQKQAFLAKWTDARAQYPDLPAYSVEMLESDPFAIDNQAESTREMLLRAEINDTFRSTFLYYAKRGNLDHLAASVPVLRMPGEDDDRFLVRILLGIMGHSTAGPKERYQFLAMSADLRVKWAEPYRIGRSPVIYIAIFSTEANGVASAGLLNTVRAAVTQPAAQVMNDTIVVQPAIQKVANLGADIWLLPDADEATVARAISNLRAAWAVEQGLGRDLVVEWWVSKLMIAGMHKVTPTTLADVVAQPTEAISIGTIDLTVKGRAY